MHSLLTRTCNPFTEGFFFIALLSDPCLTRILFYERFVRDFMRYKDSIQCAGAEMVGAVRADSRKQGLGGEYYALHIRRGDFQYKVIKFSFLLLYFEFPLFVPRM